MARETLPDDAHLQPSFDPVTCTSAQLRGIFLQHQVPAPSNLKKGELVKLFEDRVRPNVAFYAARKQVKGSAKGIRDMRTPAARAKQSATVPDSQASEDEDADLMDVDEPAPVIVKRSRAKVPVTTARKARATRSRSASVLDSDDETAPPIKELKRPRGSRARKAGVPQAAPVKEEIEDNMVLDEPTVVVPSAKKRTHDNMLDTVPEAKSSPDSARRKSGSHRRSSDGIESGFSDYNPFQQDGTERKKRRKSSLAPSTFAEPEPEPELNDEPPRPPPSARKPPVPSPLGAPPVAGPSKLSSRKSMPALRDVMQEADYDVPAPPMPASQPRAKPRASMPVTGRAAGNVPQAAFKPYMAPLEMLKSPPDEYKDLVRRASAAHSSPAPSSSASRALAVTPAADTSELRRKSSSSALGSPVTRRSPTTAVAIRKAVPVSTGTAQRLSVGLVAVLLLSYLGLWHQERFNIGYCDSGTGTNARAIDRAAAFGALAPSCMPCPAHGTCAEGILLHCEADYVRQPSLLGIGGLLPVAEHCAPDNARLIKVAESARRISAHLRKYRGMVECGYLPASSAIAKRSQRGVEAWKVYGMTDEDLRQELVEKVEVPDKVASAEHFFRLGLQDLVDHNEIVEGVNAGGHTLYAATAGDLPASCRAKRAVINYASERKRGISGLLSAIFSILYFRMWLRQRREERESTADLVAIALDKLQEQMAFHYKDQALTPNGWIAPGQLRDQILAHEHSAARRARLWRNVEKVVVGNSNVRRQHAEYRGEPTVVWEWIGPLGLIEAAPDVGGTPGSAIRGSAARRKSAGARVSFGGAEQKALYPSLT